MGLKDDLIAARALIDTPEKWRKDDRETEQSCCAAIAMDRVDGFSGSMSGWDALYDALYDEWKTNDDEPGICIGLFNDHPDTAHADIMALFDRAIAAAS